MKLVDTGPDLGCSNQVETSGTQYPAPCTITLVGTAPDFKFQMQSSTIRYTPLTNATTGFPSPMMREAIPLSHNSKCLG